MRSNFLKHAAAFALPLVVAAWAVTPALAVGTPAGTVISNQATVDFEDVNGNPLTALSNVVTTTVSTVASVDISPAALASNADPGDLVCYLHTITNGGNATDTIDVVTASSQGWTVTVYNSSGVPTTTAVTSNKFRADSDLDGLPDVFERALGTHPRQSDTDADTLFDIAEFDADNTDLYYDAAALAQAVFRCNNADDCAAPAPIA